MKLLVINKLLINRGWQLTNKTNHIHLLSPADQSSTERLIVLPAKSNGLVPVGTVEAVMRRTGQSKSISHWHSHLSEGDLLHLVIEKSSEGLWGRLEMKGLMIVVQGLEVTSLITQTRAILALVLGDLVVDPQVLVESLRFESCHDLIEVWALLRQVRGSYIADASGVDIALINQFMNGSAFPSAEQTYQIQQSIQHLGHQLLQLSS